MRFGCVYKRTFHTSFNLVPNKGINNKDQVKHKLKNNKFSIMNNNTYQKNTGTINFFTKFVYNHSPYQQFIENFVALKLS